MTWVIGRPGIFGYSVALSDIRITLADGAERDCLQKVYRVGQNLALGFAGSVKIGLNFVELLAAGLDGQDPKAMWNPLQIAELFPASAQQFFNSFPGEERRLGCHLMLLSAHPTQNDGDAPWARCYVHRFYSPNFRPLVTDLADIVSIGSGSSPTMPRYAEALRNLESDHDVFNLEMLRRGGSAMGYMTYLTSTIEKHPQPGISPHLHVCLITRDGVFIGTNDREVQDHPEENFVMPKVAQSWDELQNLLAGVDASLELASC